MRLHGWKLGLGALACGLILGASGVGARAETLRIGGTGSALSTMERLGDAFSASRPDLRVEVLPSLGSSGGIKALLAGAIDIAVSSRPLKDDERDAGAEAELIARTPLAVVSHLSNRTETITIEELAAMYAGEVVTWPDGTPVRLVIRPKDETDTKLLRGLSPEMDEAMTQAFERPGLVIATTDQESAQMLEQVSGSLGVAATGQLNSEGRRLRVLALDGVVPSAALLRDPDYRFVKDIHVVTRPEATATAVAFSQFVRSPEAREILLRTDYMTID